MAASQKGSGQHCSTVRLLLIALLLLPCTYILYVHVAIDSTVLKTVLFMLFYCSITGY